MYAYIYINSLQKSKILTYAPKMTDILGFQVFI